MSDKREKKLWQHLCRVMISGTLMLLVSGCSTVIKPPPGGVTDAGEPFTVGKVSNTQLQTSLTTVTSDNYAVGKVLSSRIHNDVSGKMAAAGYVLSERGADVGVRVETEARLFDKSGNFIRYNGQADAEIIRLFDKKLLARNSFASEGPRTLGETEAVEALATFLSPLVTDWIAGALTPSAVGLTAVTMEVKRPWIRRDDAAYVSKFVRIVSNLDGVVSCTHLPGDVSGRTYLFRIVYFPDRVPEGIVIRLANVAELNLKQ